MIFSTEEDEAAKAKAKRKGVNHTYSMMLSIEEDEVKVERAEDHL